MLRDLTMIFSVLLSVLSLSFGVYKNIEAGNARGFAYEQAYRVMGAVQDANISASAKATIIDEALTTLATPPPVVDLSRSSADAGPTQGACADDVKAFCAAQAELLGEANAVCVRAKDVVCAPAAAIRADIVAHGCFRCF